MAQKRHRADQIISKLRRADVELGKGKKVPEVCKLIEIKEQTYYRWRQKYGSMQPGVIPKRGHLDVRDSQNYQGFVDCSGILVARTPECGIVRCTRIVELPRKLAVFEC